MLASLLAVPAHAVAPDEILANPALEARARDLSRNLRCLVCQNQSIDDSDAPLARDLRLLVRERLSQGDSDAAVIAFVVARYGTFVLLRPPVQTNTILLWLAPLVLLLGAIVGFRRHLPGWAGGGTTTAPSAPAELTAEEAKRLDSLLDPPTAREAGRSLEKPADRT